MTDPDAPLIEALLRVSRPLVGIALRSLQAAPVEVTLPQYRVLVLLEENGTLTIGAIAAELAVNPSNATRVCDRLERLGLTERAKSPDDGRAVLVGLTAAARDVLDVVNAERRTELSRVVAQLTDRDPALAATLDSVSRAAHEVERADQRTPDR